MMAVDSHAQELWVFGYGSLIWRPGFEYAEAHLARVVGFQRAFCIYSTHHRGNDERPGLVLGLDRGGTCEGMAYRIGGRQRRETIDYLRAREQVSGVYREIATPIQLLGESGAIATAITYIVEQAHPSYAHRLPFGRQVDIIRGARGLSGPNIEYLVNTSAHLRDLGIRDRNMERLAAAAGGLFAASHENPEVLYRRSCSLAAASRIPVAAGPKLRPDERRRFLFRNNLS